MKSLSGIILCAATLLSQAGMPVLLGQAGSFTNGQAARLVIGQATFTS